MTDAPPFRCAAASLARDEDLAGSASTVRAFLLLENPGPWGVHALREARLPTEVLDRLRLLERAHRVRPLLIRPCGRRTAGAVRLFVAWTAGHHPRLETTTLDDPRALLDLDPAALASGRPLGLDEAPQPLIGVCTHGRHDACCAEQGRPASAALAQAHPELAWQVSHIGGDRFAGNMVVLPHGLYYGRVDAGSAVAVADAHLAGRVELGHLRGRSGWAMPVQAAEVALRRRLGETRLDAVRLVRRRRDPDAGLTRVDLEVDGARWAVEVVTTTGPERAQLTCRAGRENPLPHHEVRRLEPLS